MEHHGTIVKVIGDAISSKSRSTSYQAPQKKKKKFSPLRLNIVLGTNQSPIPLSPFWVGGM
jgi:hypothetical protein